MTPHTDKEIEQAAQRFERLAETLDPETAKVESTEDLRAIATAAEAVRADDARLREAVLLARAAGRSWNRIAVALGVSRQAARQRFADKANVPPVRPGASFRPYDEEFAAKLDEIANAFYACRMAFRAVVEETQWRPADGSPAHRDTERLLHHKPSYPTETPMLLSFTIYFYLSAAAEHLGGLGALYRQREVLIPPGFLVRGVVEHCAHILWMIQQGNQPVEDRLARAYLELLLSAEERKKTTGRVLGKSNETYQAAAAEFKEIRKRARAVFGEPTADEHGRAILRGQQMPGPEDCVSWMFGFIDQSPTVGRGVYDYISNIAHPTLYPHIEMWEPRELDGVDTLVSQIAIEDHVTHARIAVVPFYETLSYVMSYNGWPRDRHDELTVVLERLLPGLIKTGL